VRTLVQSGVPAGWQKKSQDATPGFVETRGIGEGCPGLASWDILSNSQPSLPGLFLALIYPRTDVLGYSQPSLRD